MDVVEGFSKWSKSEKIEWLLANCPFSHKDNANHILRQYWNTDPHLQKQHEDFSENTLSNFYLPFGIAPNFLINDVLHIIPMVIEESSVIAAACKASKFWLKKGGFKARVISTEKLGHIHFSYTGNKNKLEKYFNFIKPSLKDAIQELTKNMTKRGGGLVDIVFSDQTTLLPHYYQLVCTFQTGDAMGANFINSCLETLAKTFQNAALVFEDFSQEEKDIEVIMCILSNYVPNCLVRVEVCCNINELDDNRTIPPKKFAERFVRAVDIANASPYRAVTHNKGIMNGIDAVVLATGNDFRAVEAAAHAYACKSGHYKSLTQASIKDDVFSFWIEIPLALGTVGGLTTLHPLSKLSLEILGNPSAPKLMEIAAVAGLAQNFAAIKSLITTGIQKGHMKMHLTNILNQIEATDSEKTYLTEYFKDKTFSYSSVSKALKTKRELS